jgi:adhesin transport system outer membrane protein
VDLIVGRDFVQNNIIAIASLLAGSLTLCGSLGAQSLSEAVQLTLKTNPDIQASKYNLTAAEELYTQAKAGYFPSVDLVLSGGRENSNNTTTRALGEDNLYLSRAERSFRVTQLLYDGFATRNLVRQQSALVHSALSRLASSQENISLRAIQVYLEVLRRNEIVRLTDGNLREHEQTLGKIRERFENGVGTKVDVVQTVGRRAQAKSNLLLAQRETKNGNAQFYRVVSEEPDSLTRPEVIQGLPATLEMAIESAYRNNPGIQAVAADLEAAMAAHKQARGVFQPRFDLELGATRNDDTDGSVGPNDDETAVVRMTYNLYHGGADRARLNETEAREFAARETLRSVKLAVQEDVTLVWNELEDLLVRLEYLKSHVDSTDEVLVVYNEQLSLGKRTLLDLLDVQNEQLRARVAYTTGQYSELLARYRVLASVGGLLNGLGIVP